MTTFNWKVTAMNCYPESEGKTDMVFNVHWTCTGTDDVSGFSGSCYSTCHVPYNPDNHWIDYAALTQAEVLEWIYENGVNKDATEAAIQQQIDNQINPPVVSLPLPWASA